MRIFLSTLLLLVLTVPGHGQPPEPKPPTVTVTTDNDHPPEPTDLEPVAVITGQSVAVLGIPVELSALSSRNMAHCAWRITPQPDYMRVSVDERTLTIGHTKPATFTVILAVATKTGRVTMVDSRIELKLSTDAEPAIPSLKPPVSSPEKPAPAQENPDAALKDLVTEIRKNPTQRAELVAALRMIAAQCLTGAIRTVDEFERAVATHTKVDQKLLNSAIDVVDMIVGDDENFGVVATACNRVATVLESTK